MKVSKAGYIIFFTIFLLTCSIFSEAQKLKGSGFIINGHIEGIKNGTKVYLHNIDEQLKIDSAVAVEGNFTFKGQVESPTACWIECKDQYAIVMVENTVMKFRSPLKNMRLYAVAEGGREQLLQNQLAVLQHPYEKVYFGAYDSLVQKQYQNKEHEKLLAQKLNDYQDSAQHVYIAFGKQHPNSYLGLDIIYRNRQSIGKEGVEPLYAQLDEALRSTPKGQALKTFLYGELAQKGKGFIDFEVQTLEGTPFKLSSLKGSYILLSFWSAGCVPCRREHKKISSDYSRLKDNVSFVSFSLDKNKSTWQKASREDNILWANVSDLKGDAGRVKALYDVQSIPTSFLIDKEGVIIEKFIGLEEDFLNQLQKIAARK